jgi:hypothetical protein
VHGFVVPMILHNICSLFSQHVSIIYAPWPVAVANNLYGPSELHASFPSLAFFLPMSTQQRTNSPGRKYLCLTFLLYSAVVTHFKGASVWEAYFLVSSKKSNSSVMYCEFSPVARRVYKVFHLVVYVLHLVF